MKKLHLIFVVILSAVLLLGAKKPEKKTIFETGTEEIKKHKKAVLTIPNAKGLEIYIFGEIHHSEVLRIYEYHRQKQGEEIYQGQGVLKIENPLLVVDNKILVTLTTKDKTTRKGATVEIKELKTERFLEHVRKNIVDVFHKLEKNDHIVKIDQYLQESNELLEKLASQDQKQISESLRALAEKYRAIASQKKAIFQTHQFLRKDLLHLATQSKKWSKQLTVTIKKQSPIEKELIEQQSTRWLEGAKNFLTLADQIQLYNKTLNELFNNLEENARILYETANSIDLRLNPLSKVLEKLKDSTEALQALDTHWKHLHKLKENLKQSGFL